MSSERSAAVSKRQNDAQESLRELLHHLAIDSGALIRDEMALAKQEIKEQLTRMQSAVVVVSIGALLGTVALMTLSAAAVIGLGDSIGYALSALIVAIFIGIIAGVVISTGVVHARNARASFERDLERDFEVNLPAKPSKEGLIHG
ncbi:MAG TPA: phage holin family protein [Blastocatellia bacterium]